MNINTFKTDTSRNHRARRAESELLEGVEIFWLGPADHSATKGFAGQWEGPEVAEEVKAIASAIVAEGKHVGISAQLLYSIMWSRMCILKCNEASVSSFKPESFVAQSHNCPQSFPSIRLLNTHPQSTSPKRIWSPPGGNLLLSW